MVELASDSTNILDVTEPGNGEALAGPAEMRCDLLGPLEGHINRQ